MSSILAAQSRSKPDPDSFLDRLWLGMHIGNLSFGTNQFGNGTFNINLAPVVGLDLIQSKEPGPRTFFTSLSAGMMLKIDYYYSKLNISPQLDKYTSVDLGPTIFTRLLTFEKVFAQLEFEKATFQRPSSQNPFENQKFKQDYLYVGLGYSSGEDWRYEISIYYNLLDDFDYIRIPFDYRIAIIYHF
jgi:hypothetical protein